MKKMTTMKKETTTTTTTTTMTTTKKKKKKQKKKKKKVFHSQTATDETAICNVNTQLTRARWEGQQAVNDNRSSLARCPLCGLTGD